VCRAAALSQQQRAVIIRQQRAQFSFFRAAKRERKRAHDIVKRHSIKFACQHTHTHTNKQIKLQTIKENKLPTAAISFSHTRSPFFSASRNGAWFFDYLAMSCVDAFREEGDAAAQRVRQRSLSVCACALVCVLCELHEPCTAAG